MIYVWDIFVRAFHWALVLAFGVAYYTHASEWDRMLHVQSGYVAGFLLVARIVWGLYASGYANFKSFPLSISSAWQHTKAMFSGHSPRYIGHNPIGSLVIYSMLADGLITIISGWMVFNDDWLLGDYELLSSLHYYAAWIWVGLVLMHVAGVVVETILHQDNLILAMITGHKRKSRPAEVEK